LVRACAVYKFGSAEQIIWWSTKTARLNLPSPGRRAGAERTPAAHKILDKKLPVASF
jgi:hypothetical protein